MVIELRDVVGFRGEKLVELRLTDYSEFEKPLFRPGFLGDKWPAIDLYVELNSVRGKRPYFFAQVKATSSLLTAESTHLSISTKKNDVERLLRIPGPTVRSPRTIAARVRAIDSHGNPGSGRHSNSSGLRVDEYEP